VALVDAQASGNPLARVKFVGPAIGIIYAGYWEHLPKARKVANLVRGA
jgi:hypothetical protein